MKKRVMVQNGTSAHILALELGALLVVFIFPRDWVGSVAGLAFAVTTYLLASAVQDRKPVTIPILGLCYVLAAKVILSNPRLEANMDSVRMLCFLLWLALNLVMVLGKGLAPASRMGERLNPTTSMIVLLCGAALCVR